MCPQKLIQLDLKATKPVKNNQMNASTPEEGPAKKPFYYSPWWLLLWSIFLWPIGLIMMWGYFANMKKNEISRTNSINEEVDKELEDLYVN